MSNHQQIAHAPPPPPPATSHLERKWKPRHEKSPNCPRCTSANTKFCYYNNYSLSQPRYHCKSCRRYFTKGGSLRNLPHGGGAQKSRRSKSSSAADSHVSTTQSSSDDDGPEIDLAAVFARFLNSDTSPESDDTFHNLTAENSQISLEELSDNLLQDPKQGITEDYEAFPFGLQTQLGLEDFDSFSSNYDANYYLRVSDQFCGDSWVNDIDFF